MPVIANCLGCETSIRLGARPANGCTTACPDCGSTSYVSEAIGDDERDRIVALATSTPGIGDDTAAALAERMVTVDRLRDATLHELRAVPGIGTKNGRALRERVT